ncbi:phospholipase D family protein [Teredinibacter franksiae]|uniref:phospholipase D family protein n=1 Tax=Teredinibacter franksiae TaxID=2761453 RepID=UPI00162415D0|nr:phospholipase D family protein [Teredinibacter franksiae]
MAKFFLRCRSLCLALGLFLLSACAEANFEGGKAQAQVLGGSGSSSLRVYTQAWGKEHGYRKSAFYPLREGLDALGARLRLLDAAEQSIDVQYFLMKDDVVGHLFSSKLLAAADRGVRVRFLLDDIFTTITDVDLYVLDQHRNIEVRLFNPIARRGFRHLNYISDFSRANRRMHNKSFTVDGCFTIVGGRNIGSEYFSLKENSEFFDLDVLAMGAVVKDVADSFDEFWGHSKAVPIEDLADKPSEAHLDSAKAGIEQVMQSEGIDIYRRAIDSRLLDDLIEKRIDSFVADAYVISESPKKLELSVGDSSMRLSREIGDILLNAKAEVVIFNPYFIPTKKGMPFWQQVIDNGVQVSLITNSLASTNHVPVHSAYEKYRKDLLKMGFSLFEARPDAMQIIKGVDQVSTLHTKLIVVDRRYAFIGSLNMDPRSVIINTEMGILIDSKELAEKLLANRDAVFEKIVYQLHLSQDNEIEWHGRDFSKTVIHQKEPQTTWWRRFTVNVYKLLPEGQL